MSGKLKKNGKNLFKVGLWKKSFGISFILGKKLENIKK